MLLSFSLSVRHICKGLAMGKPCSGTSVKVLLAQFFIYFIPWEAFQQLQFDFEMSGIMPL
jgi:hypothetical protein